MFIRISPHHSTSHLVTDPPHRAALEVLSASHGPWFHWRSERETSPWSWDFGAPIMAHYGKPTSFFFRYIMKKYEFDSIAEKNKHHFKKKHRVG